jgi:hypothetical protein
MTAPATGSPGSHPHTDQPNWRPADTYEEYIVNCREGLETYSERRVAKLLGMSRIHLWRAHMMAAIPDDLFELLMVAGRRNPRILSSKALASIGQMFTRDVDNVAEVEHCPHCGGLVRIRPRVNAKLARVVADWLRDQPSVAP